MYCLMIDIYKNHCKVLNAFKPLAVKLLALSLQGARQDSTPQFLSD